ncbi:DNA cross-link repair 1A protein [Erysiphe neolycopersici]|uniref:DNA cross-link repair 1A protein n=1 Tax=Erysiphe neolycopersici TaxID=212602 RepID=A0A420HUE6_9PEZI|nr:DNA cross-link repair 1A protein [Erysiphe neolycopersici]
MFRNPRENLHLPSKDLMKPSVGRPPTPPKFSKTTKKNSPRHETQLSRLRNIKIQSSAKKSEKSKRSFPVKVTAGKSNTSILEFFKKVDAPVKDEKIFLDGGSQPLYRPSSPKLLFLESESDECHDYSRFNETTGSVKRRKISGDNSMKDKITISNKEILESKIAKEVVQSIPTEISSLTLPTIKINPRKDGPFFEDSDTDEESHESVTKSSVCLEFVTNKDNGLVNDTQLPIKLDPESSKGNIPNIESIDNYLSDKTLNNGKNSVQDLVATCEDVYKRGVKNLGLGITSKEFSPNQEELIEQQTNYLSRISEEWDCFDDDEPSAGDFIFGEEVITRRWMKEQDKFEREDEILRTITNSSTEPKQLQKSLASTTCPVCNAEFRDISEIVFSKHVNECLDFSLAPKPVPDQIEVVENKSLQLDFKSKFARRAAIPRPGQESPFEIEALNPSSSSAFSRLMSGKIEDTAWKNAAASESSSRGKPAYQRTCPFYKIIPGFSICVDAFRYGAVQGCNAYFLSHFHSDHYIGLSSSWCHGPIYCSRVTANLVKQQLRVDPKYVVPLEFEKKFKIPETPDVYVSMISANHCPGSSLFLYEKITDTGTSSRSQRVLHCGDFRACPAHISHPQLMPDVLDSITKQYKHQKIDVCYLDTTYLNPRYAFPPQEQVIQACVEMCLSLRNERAEEDGSWELAKRERISSGISKFLGPAKNKAGEGHFSTSPPSTKNRGRLLIVCGTYSIGKERICLGIARALNCKIFAPARKMRICAALEDEELMSRMTSDPREAQIHMQMLMEIRAETLQDYLNSFKPHFSRIVGFRPSGWTYKPPTSRGTQTATIPQILNSPSWRSSFCFSDLIPQRGSTRESACFGVPYSEHSSFRELTMFICALRIEKIIPTVNVGSASGRAKMKGWIERWLAERRKNGPIKIGEGEDEVKWC